MSKQRNRAQKGIDCLEDQISRGGPKEKKRKEERKLTQKKRTQWIMKLGTTGDSGGEALSITRPKKRRGGSFTKVFPGELTGRGDHSGQRKVGKKVRT